MINITKQSLFLVLSLLYFLVALSSCKTTSKTQATTKPALPAPSPAKPTPPKEEEVKKPGEIISLKFALIMPFELEDNFAQEQEHTSEPEINPGSLTALNFYEGALMAVDSLKHSRRNVTINVYDTPSDSAGIARMLYNPQLQEANVVIGTFPNNLSAAAAAIAKKAGIKLILTQAASPDFLAGNDNVALAYASTITQCREMVACMLKNYPGANIILSYRKLKREDELAEVYRKEILSMKGDAEVKEFNATEKKPVEIIDLISKTRRNLVFIVSSDEAFVSPLLSTLEEQNIFGIITCGLPTWQNFESIDFMVFKNIQVHIFENNFIDPSRDDDKNLRKQFMAKYYTDPMNSAFNGFELVYNLAGNFTSKTTAMGELMDDSFRRQEEEYLFKEVGTGGGLENRKISVLKFNDYSLERINCNGR